jgi:hypothetical protein
MKHNFKAPSIKEVHIGDAPSVYEGYLYRFTDLDTGKMYVGIHKGSVEDEYWHSSTNDEFAKICQDSNSNLKFEILEYGDYEEMTVAEHRILKENDARNNPMFFNKTNGSPKFTQPDMDAVKELFDRIKAGEFLITKEPVYDVFQLKRLQVRLVEDKELRREIKERIDEAFGNTNECDPVIIYEGRGQSGEDIVGDGNHTLNGANDSKHCIEIPVIRIPKEVLDDYSNMELRALSNLFNAKPKITKKPIDIDDAVKYIIGTCSYGAPHDSLDNKKFLSMCRFTKKTITSILKKAKIEIDKNNLALANKLWIDYTIAPHKLSLTTKVDSFRNDGKTISLAYSSAMFKWDHIFNSIFALTEVNPKTKNRESKYTNVVITVYHPNSVAEENWKMIHQPDALHKLKYWLTPRGYSFKINEMPSTIVNTLD